MDQKKAIAISLGVLAAVILFAVVYSQFAPRRAMAPTGDQVWSGSQANSAQPAVPVADPETPSDVATAIDSQLSEDSASLDAEMAAETADVEDDVKSLDDLNNTYDENAY